MDVWRDSRATLVVAFAVVLAGASGCRGALTHEADGNDAGDPSFGGTTGDDAATTPFGVVASASPSAVCAGACVELSARATGGVGLYTYAWDHDLAGSGSPQTVCPSVTTTYAVVARDSSGKAGELARPAAQDEASVTVTVDPTCSGGSDDGGAPGRDGALPAGAATGLGHTVCSASWPMDISGGDATNFDSRMMFGNVITDPAGNIFTVVSHTGTAVIDGVSYSATGSATGAIVMKLDPSCHVLWARELGAPGAEVMADSIAVDAASNVFVGGALAGVVNFGTGVVSGPSTNAALLLKLDPKGSTLWAKTFPSTVSTGSALSDLSIDPGGNVLLLAMGGPDIDLGGGPVGGTANDSTFLAKIDTSGKLLFAKAPSSLGMGDLTFWRLATNRTGGIWIAALGADATGSTSSVPVVALDGQGAVVYSRLIEQPANVMYWNGSAIKVDDANHVAQFTGWYGASGPNAGYDGSLRMLSQLSASGTPTTTTVAPYLSNYTFGIDGAHFLGMSPDGASYVGSAFTGSLDLGALGTFTSTMTQTIDVTVTDAAGNLRAAVQWTDGFDEIPGDLTVDAQGNAILVGSDYAGASTNTLSFFVAKLGW